MGFFAWLFGKQCDVDVPAVQTDSSSQEVAAPVEECDQRPPMFLIQRAVSSGNPVWQTVRAYESEQYARQEYQKKLQFHTTGRFRLLNPAGEVLAEDKPSALFHRKDDTEEQRLPTYFIPTPPAVRRH